MVFFVCLFFPLRIKMSTQEQEEAEKKYDPLDKTLKFVDRGDDLDPVCKNCLLLNKQIKTYKSERSGFI